MKQPLKQKVEAVLSENPKTRDCNEEMWREAMSHKQEALFSLARRVV